MDKKIATVTTFGAGLAAMGVATELQADVIELTLVPGSVPPQSTSVSVAVDIVGVGGASDFLQWNDGFGQTFFGFNINGAGGFDIVSTGQTLDPGTFTPTYVGLNVPGGTTATLFLGFHDGLGNVGWFSISFGGPGGDIQYGGGQFGTMGETITVVPAPAALAMLALGAAGIRRKRAA